MHRAVLLALLLAAQPALAIFGIETDPDKIDAQWLREKIEAVTGDGDAKERADAAQWLGGHTEPAAIAALAKALSDRDAKVREAAARGLWRSGDAAAPARPQLVAALQDADPNVVAQAAGALQALGMGEEELVAPRKRVFESPEASLSSRFLVSRNLIGHEPPVRLLDAMVAYLDRWASSKSDTRDGNVELAQKALERLAKTQDRTLIVPMMDATRKVNGGQAVLLQTLRTFAPPPEGYTEFLVVFLNHPDPRVRYAALGSLRPLTQEKQVLLWAPRASALLRDPDSSVRVEALWALGSGAGLASAEIDKVVPALSDPEASVRRSAARAIGEMGDRNQAVPAAAKARVADASRAALAKAAESDADADVRDEAKRSLAKLAGPAGAAPANVASAAPAGGGGEAAGMAVLRARKVEFEESMYFRALSEVDLELIRAFLDAGMSPTKAMLEMGPPLRIMLFGEACSAGVRPTKQDTKSAIRLLLDRGADVNGADGHGNTPLMEAASHGCDRETMKMLIKAGAKVDAKNQGGLTPFEMGLFQGHDGLEEIIAAGYRLPPDKAKMYAQGYAGSPAALAMIRKATAKK